MLFLNPYQHSGHGSSLRESSASCGIHFECLLQNIVQSFLPLSVTLNARPATRLVNYAAVTASERRRTLRRSGEILAPQRRSAFLPKSRRARGQASAPAPHLCKPLNLCKPLSLSLNLSFSPATAAKESAGANHPARESRRPCRRLPARGRSGKGEASSRSFSVERISSDQPSCL